MIELIEPSQLSVECRDIPTLAEWVARQGTENGGCPPCDLAVITPWYRDILKQQGYHKLAKEVEALASEWDASKIALVLDTVRDSVQDERVSATLKAYDCMMQTYKE